MMTYSNEELLPANADCFEYGEGALYRGYYVLAHVVVTEFVRFIDSFQIARSRSA